MSLKRLPHGATQPHAAPFERSPPPAQRAAAERRGRLAPGGMPALQPVVIRFGRLGDMIMLSSVLPRLHHRFRKPCLVLGAGPWNEPLYRGHPDVERVWSFARHIPFVIGAAWWSAVWALRRSDPGPIYVCERHPRQLSRVRRLLALSGVNPARCLFITDTPAGNDEHWVDRFVRFVDRTPAALRAADYPLPLSGGLNSPRLQVLDSERAQREAWLRARGWSGRTLVLVQPGNYRSMSRRRDHWRRFNADDKSWPTKNWVALLRRIHQRMPDALLVLCGAPPEARMLQEIRSAARLEALVEAELPLRELLALCESAHSMISVDTGPAHAAAALGLPLIVLYGAESPRCWLPRSPVGSPVLGVGGPPHSVRVDEIAVEDVFNTWCALLEEMQAARVRPAAGSDRG